MRKYIICLAALAACAQAFVSCMDNRGENMPDDRVFIPNSGPTVYTVYNLDNSESSMPIRVQKGGNRDGGATAWFTIDESLLREYNDGMMFAEDHVSLLPADCYRFDKDNAFDLTDLMSQANTTLYYTPSKIASYSYGKKYALPIRLNANGLAVNDDKDNMIIIFDVVEPTIYLAPQTINMVPNMKNNTGMSAEIRAMVDFVAAEEYTASIAVGGRNSASVADEVAAYNASKGTSYKVLPAELYTIAPLDLTLPTGASEVSSILSITPTEEMLNGSYDGEFLVPVVLNSARKNSNSEALKIVEGKDMCYVFVSISRRSWVLEAADKVDWKVINARSMTPDGGDHSLPILVDGIFSTSDNYVGIKWSESSFFDSAGSFTEAQPQWWAIDLGKVVNLAGVRVDGRGPSSNFTAASARIYASETAPTGDPDAKTGIYAPIVSNLFSGTYKPLTDDAALWGESLGSMIDLANNQNRIVSLATPVRARYVLLYFYAGSNNLALSEFSIQILPD